MSVHGLFSVQAQRERGAGREKRKEREISSSFYIGPSQVALVVKNPSANVRHTRDARDVGSIPGWGRSPGEANGNPLQYSCWKIQWTEEPGGLQSMGSESRI